MRKVASVKAPRGSQVSGAYRFPAATGGMNNRDPAQNLPPNESPYMRDCYPSVSGIKIRPGYATWASGLPAISRTLMTYTNNAGTQTMFAASGTEFYNVTSSGAVGAAVVTGLTNSTWQYINFTNSATTQYLCAFNGVDSPRYWDGATWTTVTGVSTPSITGLTTSTIFSAFIHQRRMWLVQKDSLKVWYLPTDSVGGAAQALDLGGVASRGGYVVAGSTWTIDGGDGVDDLWVVVTSNGQMIAYRGIDPSSAATWEIAGTWNIANPCGRLCLYKYRGDLLIITKIGILSARAIMSGLTDAAASISDKISGTFRDLALTTSDRPQLIEYDEIDLLIFNPGGYNGGNYYCYAMNRSSGAWSGGWGLGTTSMTIYNGLVYYSTQYAASVTRKLSGITDGSGVVDMALQTSLSDLGLPAQVKSTKIGRVSGTIPNLFFGMTVSVDEVAINQPTLESISSPIYTYTNWYPIGGAGTNFAVFMRITSDLSVIINGVEIIFESGGLVGATALT